MLAGQVMVGDSVSLIATVKLQVAVPQPLEAVQFTVLAPTGNECGDVMIVAPILHSTVGVGSPVTVRLNAISAAHCPASALVVTSLVQTMPGAVRTVRIAGSEVTAPQPLLTTTL